jgi:hypothetical protein
VKAGLVIAGCIVTAINLLLFGLLISRLSPVQPLGGTSHLYDAISIQITILTVVLGAVALGLAAAAFFGYQALEAVVLRRADELVSRRLELQKPSQSQTGTGLPPTPPEQGVSQEEQPL